MKDSIDVTVAYAAPRIEALVRLRLAAGSVVADAVAASGLLDRHELDPRALGYAIFGARALASTPLAAGDRVELTRPLLVDPKEARRRRAESKARPTHRPKTKRGSRK
jgi:putative ubiquitin-RnfH superfamily antitoxin RatB of RatAB toxin-antitoxin module